ncbi:hypothetical protein, partial [Filifactor villosus]
YPDFIEIPTKTGILSVFNSETQDFFVWNCFIIILIRRLDLQAPFFCLFRNIFNLKAIPHNLKNQHKTTFVRRIKFLKSLILKSLSILLTGSKIRRLTLHGVSLTQSGL